MKVNLTKEGYESIMPDYMAIIVQRFLGMGTDFTMVTREAWKHANAVLKKFGRTISRASIINGMNALVDEGILTYTERTGKGGYHRVYKCPHTREQLEKFVVEKITDFLFEQWPVAAEQVLM